jgi:hypothetical protein
MPFFDKLKNKNGIWVTEKQSSISYPEEGNDRYFQIENESFWFRHRNNCIISLARDFKIKEPFFDIGGGNGFVSRGMQQAGFEVILLEPGLSGCLNAQKQGLKNIICSTLEESGIAKDQIPAGGLFDVVEHIQDDIGFLRKVQESLVPDGLLILTVPAFNALWSDEDRYIGHFRRYTLKTITKALEEAGFQIEYKTYLFSFLIVPILFFRSLPSLLKINTKRGEIKTIKKDHLPAGPSGKIINSLLRWERKMVEKKKQIWIGSSCLLIARKPNSNKDDHFLV